MAVEDIKPLPAGTIKLVFFDLDGTLVNAQGVVTDAVRHEVFRLHAMGIHISFASGRPSFGAKSLMQALKIRELCMFSSSSVIYDPVTQKAVEVSFLDDNILRDFLNEARSLKLYTELYTADAYFVEKESPLSRIHAGYLGQNPEVRSFGDVVGSIPIVKVVVVSDGSEEEPRMRNLLDRFPAFHYGIARGAAHDDILFANGTDPAASREYAFHRISGALGVKPHEVISFGDGESDLPFFSLAGVSVAMGNASDMVKAKATFTTAHVEEDGVAVALQALFPHHTDAQNI